MLLLEASVWCRDKKDWHGIFQRRQSCFLPLPYDGFLSYRLALRELDPILGRLLGIVRREVTAPSDYPFPGLHTLSEVSGLYAYAAKHRYIFASVVYFAISVLGQEPLARNEHLCWLKARLLKLCHDFRGTKPKTFEFQNSSLQFCKSTL